MTALVITTAKMTIKMTATLTAAASTT